MAIDFRKSHHTASPHPVCEVLVDGAVVAAIYPTGENSFKLISAHFSSVEYDRDPSRLPKIPEIRIALDPQPYRIENGHIVRD
jgi:hypothetical protein